MTLSEVRRRWKSWLHRPTAATHPHLKLEELERLEMPSATLSLLDDINTQPVGSNPTQFTQVGNEVFFVASSAAEGTELFKTDGTTAGTVLVKDINPGRGGSDIEGLTAADGKLYFTANDGTHGNELWVSDGTSAGTALVADVAPGAASGVTQGAPVVAVGGRAYFVGSDGTHGTQLWTSDGTPAGTVALNPASVFPTGDAVVSGGVVYFTAFESTFPSSGYRLYKTDGTLAGTTQVADIGGNTPYGLTDAGGRLYFFNNVANTPAGSTLTLFTSDGTAAGTGAVQSFTSPDSAYGPSNLASVAVGTSLYFLANDGTSGRELWKSDGTAAGTALVKDINPGAAGAFPSDPFGGNYRGLLNVGGTLYFVADDGTHGPELWKSDGTDAGTALVKDLSSSTGPFVSGPSELGVVGTTVYFTDSSASPGGLYKTDGTDAGTTLVKAYDFSTFSPLQVGNPDQRIPAVNGQLVFASGPSFNNTEPWASDGTATGTRQLAVLGSGRTDGSSPGNFLQFNGVGYFTTSGGSGSAIWRTDGTPAGTVKAIPLSGFSPSLAVANGAMYYVDSAFNSTTLYRTDGTAAGSTAVKTFPSSFSSSAYVSAPVAVGTATYFTVTTSSGSYPNTVYTVDLYTTDGTSAGTTLVKSFTGTASQSLSIDLLGSAAGADFFALTTSTSTPTTFTTTSDLYATDGTGAGTVLLQAGFKTIDPFSGFSPSGVGGVALGGKLYFTADDGTHGYELWQSDGTAAGTGMVTDLASGFGSSNGVMSPLVAFGGAIYFGGYDGTTNGLFKSDGTAAGTVLLQADAGYGGRTPAVVNGALYFTVSSVDPGFTTVTMDLYTSDGTAAGTAKVATLASAGFSASRYDVRNFTAVGSTVYFFFDDGVHGSELWQTDGTQAGTKMVADLNPGVDDGVPGGSQSFLSYVGQGEPIADINGRLLFAGLDPTFGSEPFVYGDIPNNTAPTVTPVADQVTTPGTAASVAFTVGDDATPAAGLTVTATSSDTSIVPNSGLVVGGSGANRTLTVTPTAGKVGAVTITITVTDGVGTTTTDSFVLTIENRPTVTDITDQTTAEGTAATVSFTVGDVETPAADLTASATSSNTALVPSSGLVFGGSGANRTLTVTPAAGQFGTATITVTVTDANGLTATDTFVLTVNAPPTLTDITDQTTFDGTAKTVSFTVGDDRTAAGSLTVSATSSNQTLLPDSGLVFGGTGANRTLTATPVAGQTGTATITVAVTDADGAATTDTFVLTVSAPNTAPTITDITDQTTEAATAATVSFTVGDAETPAANLTVTATSSNTTLVPNGGLVLGGTGADRTLTVTPAAGQTGTATITVTVTDADGTSTSDTFVLTVNAPPTLTDITDQTTFDGTAKTVSFTVGDDRTAAGSLTVTASSSDTTLLPNDAIVLGGSGANRTLTLTPAAGQTGTTTVTVTVEDADGATTTDTFVLTVNAANTDPTITDITDQTTTSGTAKAVTFTVGDLETAAGSLTVTATSSNATLVPNSGLVFTGTGADRTLTVTPAAGQTGTATITVTVTDADGGTKSDTFVLTVNAPNTPPTVTDITDQTTTAGTAKTVAFTVGDNETAAGNLTVTATSSNPALVPNSGLTLGGTGASRTLTVTPLAGQTGTATITVTVQDADGATTTDTFVLTANPAETAPTLTPIADQTTTAGTAASVAFTVGDAETPAGNLTVSAASSNTALVPNSGLAFGGTGANRTLTVTPAAGQTGTATVTVTVTDAGGLTATRTFTLTVNPVPNTAPTVTDITDQTTAEGTAKAVAFTIGDAETPAGSLSISVTSSNATLVPAAGLVLGGGGADRTLTVTPAAGQSGTATITVTVTDAGGLTASDSFTLTVTATTQPANTPPTLTAIGDQTTGEGAAKTVTFTVGDTQTAATDLVVTVASSNPTLLPASALVLGGSGADRTLTVTPVAGQSGTATVTLTVTDAGGLTATRTFTLTVTPAVQPPTPALVGVPQFAVGSDVSGTVRFFNPDGTERLSVTPFPDSSGGVRVATGDFNGDGVADVVVGTGPGGASHVRVLDGKDGHELFAVDPFEASFTGGVFVAAGDVNGDGVADLVITPDEGGGPRVRVFSGQGFGQLADFFGIDDPNFRGGARAALADLNGDGVADLLVSAGFQGGPRVAGFDGKTVGSDAPVKLFADFFAFEDTVRNGVYLTAGDINGDGYAELIAGGGPGGGPRVSAFDGRGLVQDNTPNRTADFIAGDPNNRDGVRLAVKNLDGDKLADLIVGVRVGDGSQVLGYSGKELANASPTPDLNLDAFPGVAGGVFVG